MQVADVLLTVEHTTLKMNAVLESICGQGIKFEMRDS